MKNTLSNDRGATLVLVMVFVFVLAIYGASLLKITAVDGRNSQTHVDNQKGLFLAESGVHRAAWKIKNDDTSAETFQLKGSGTAANSLEDIDIGITITDLGSDVYQIASTSTVNGFSKTLNATVEKHPPSKVFNYAYFINNWGWFYGSPIYAYGEVRSNGRFDFKYGPTVEGDIYAAYEIGINGTVYGYGADPQYQHPYSDPVEMPNLNDLSYYEGAATAGSGNVVINGSTIVDGVLGDDGGENENLVLIGTSTNPIEINGTVVVRGDVVVSGYITGQGTIYAGRNLYVPNNVFYADGPGTEKPTYPGGAPPADSEIDSWVQTNKDKDLVGFAATESIIVGDYTASGNQWIFNNYLYSMGDEDVGEDGIPDTGDTGEGDGTFDATYEDIDGDGTWDNDYTSTDVATQVAITSFHNLPAGYSSYNDIVTNPDTYTSGSNTLNGIFYTNHAMSGAMSGTTINGSIISKDEAIGISSITMNYDWRVHSQYSSGENKVIDLDLPFSSSVEILRWWE